MLSRRSTGASASLGVCTTITGYGEGTVNNETKVRQYKFSARRSEAPPRNHLTKFKKKENMEHVIFVFGRFSSEFHTPSRIYSISKDNTNTNKVGMVIIPTSKVKVA